MFKSMNVKEKAYQAVITAIILLVSVSSLLPLLYVLSTSLVGESEYIRKNGFVFFPDHPTIEPYLQLFEKMNFVNALGVSVAKTAAGTAILLILTTIAAYALSRKDIPGRKFMVIAVLVTILFNAGLIPNFLVVNVLNLKNTLWALILPVAIDSWNVLVMKQFFENIPREMEESALIDGAGEIQMMVYIMIPMCVPVLAAIGLFAAVAHWNAWFDAMIYISDFRLQPLQLFIRNMFVSGNIAAQMGVTVINPAQKVSNETMKMALVVAGTLPILCIYPFLQKYFVKGMFLGAVKG